MHSNELATVPDRVDRDVLLKVEKCEVQQIVNLAELLELLVVL